MISFPRLHQLYIFNPPNRQLQQYPWPKKMSVATCHKFKKQPQKPSPVFTLTLTARHLKFLTKMLPRGVTFRVSKVSSRRTELDYLGFNGKEKVEKGSRGVATRSRVKMEELDLDQGTESKSTEYKMSTLGARTSHTMSSISSPYPSDASLRRRKAIVTLAAKISRWITSLPPVQIEFGQYITDLNNQINQNIHVTFDQVEDTIRPMLNELKKNYDEHLWLQFRYRVQDQLVNTRFLCEESSEKNVTSTNESQEDGSLKSKEVSKVKTGEKEVKDEEKGVRSDERDSKRSNLQKKKKRKQKQLWHSKGRSKTKSKKIVPTINKQEITPQPQDKPITPAQLARISALFQKLPRYDQQNLLQTIQTKNGQVSLISSLTQSRLANFQEKITTLLKRLGLPTTESDQEQLQSSFEIEDDF